MLPVLVFQRLPNPLRNHGRIVVDHEDRRPFEPVWAREETRNPPLNGSAAIQASWGPLVLLPPAITAASMAGNALDVEDRDRHTAQL